MNTIINRKKRLKEKLKNKKYRDSYVSSNVDVGIAFQIRALRKQRNLTQKEFSHLIGMKQERVSLLENPSNTPSVSTLKKIASALDIGLFVRFAPIGDLVKWDLALSVNSLEVPSFDEDPYFAEDASIKQFLEVTSTNISNKVIILDHYRVTRAKPLASGNTSPANTGAMGI